MTREQFNGMLRSPSVIDLNRVRDLEEIAEQFPYFQNAHLLLARQYYGHENIRYDNYLKKAAAYAPDRKVLYKLIHLPATEVVHIPSPVHAEVTAGAEVLSAEPVDAEKAVDQEKVEAVTNQPVTDSVIADEAPSNAIEAEGLQTPADDPRKVLERRLKEIENQYNPEALKSERVPVTPSAPEAGFDKPIPVQIPSEPVEKVAPPAPKPSEQSVSGMKLGFGEWLRLKSVPVAPASDTRDYFSEALAHQEPETKPEILPPSAPKPPVSKESPPADPEIIIEKFIREEPRIEPAKSEFYSPGNMARKSLIEHDDLISETLAGIYARQGNKQKALDMYMKLSLKFPEKSAYFATLSKKLEEDQG